jgi:hypothetical protein
MNPDPGHAKDEVDQHQHTAPVFFLLAKYCQMANFYLKNANFGDFFSKTHFLIAKISTQFDHFSSV